MDQQVLSDSLKYAVRISHTEEGWISPFLNAVKSTDYEAARWKPGPDVASIWELVAHAIPYTDSRLRDLTGETYSEEDDWPLITDASPEAWASCQSRVARVVTRLQTLVDGLSEHDLATPAPGKKTPRAERLVDIAIHDAYHAGQVVKLQQVFAAVGREAARV